MAIAPLLEAIESEMFYDMIRCQYGSEVINNLFGSTTILSEHVLEKTSLANDKNVFRDQDSYHFICVRMQMNDTTESFINKHGHLGVFIIHVVDNLIRIPQRETDDRGFRKQGYEISSHSPHWDCPTNTYTIFPSEPCTLSLGREVWNVLHKPLPCVRFRAFQHVEAPLRGGEKMLISNLLPHYKSWKQKA